MMVEDSRGSKRRLSNADESERLSQRQMILNMSICKMQRDSGKVEPKLLRTVLITNTVRRIEKEMEDEMTFHTDKSDAALLSTFVKSLGSTEVNWAKKEATNALSEASTPANLEQSFADIGIDIKPVACNKTNNNDDPLEAEDMISAEDNTKAAVPASNKFGCIGDRRRPSNPDNPSTENSTTTELQDRTAHFYLPNFILPSIFDVMDDSYMADFSSLPLESDSLASGLNQLWNDDWRSLPDLTTTTTGALTRQGTCASEVEKAKGDSFFEDLDQVMQVLVGM